MPALINYMLLGDPLRVVCVYVVCVYLSVLVSFPDPTQLMDGRVFQLTVQNMYIMLGKSILGKISAADHVPPATRKKRAVKAWLHSLLNSVYCLNPWNGATHSGQVFPSLLAECRCPN